MMLANTCRGAFLTRQPSTCETTLKIGTKQQTDVKIRPTGTFNVHVTEEREASSMTKPSWNCTSKANAAWQPLGFMDGDKKGKENGGRRSKSPNMLGRRTNTPTMQSSNSRSNTPINSTSRIPVNRSSSRTPNTTCTPTTGNSRPAMNNSSSRIPVNSSSAKRNPTVVTRSISIQCNMPSLDTDATDTTATRDSPPPSEFEEPVLRQRSGGEKRDRSSMTEFLSTETMLLEVRPGTPSVETDEFLSFEATLSEVDEHNHTTPTETTDPSEDADAALEQAFSEAYICNVVSPSTRAHRQRMQQMRAARMHAEERELYSKDEANCYTVHYQQEVPAVKAPVTSMKTKWV